MSGDFSGHAHRNRSCKHPAVHGAVADLSSCCHDAREFAAQLAAIPHPFSVSVHTAENVDMDEFRAAEQEFLAQIQQRGQSSSPLEFVIVFLASHGCQWNADLFLAARNSRLADTVNVAVCDLPSNLMQGFISIDSLIRGIHQHWDGPLFVAADTCRNSPYPHLPISTRELSEGMQYRENLLCCFSTSVGAVSRDGTKHAHNPFTSALLATVFVSGTPLRSAVLNACNMLGKHEQPSCVVTKFSDVNLIPAFCELFVVAPKSKVEQLHASEQMFTSRFESALLRHRNHPKRIIVVRLQSSAEVDLSSALLLRDEVTGLSLDPEQLGGTSDLNERTLELYARIFAVWEMVAGTDGRFVDILLFEESCNHWNSSMVLLDTGSKSTDAIPVLEDSLENAAARGVSHQELFKRCQLPTFDVDLVALLTSSLRICRKNIAPRERDRARNAKETFRRRCKRLNQLITELSLFTPYYACVAMDVDGHRHVHGSFEESEWSELREVTLSILYCAIVDRWTTLYVSNASKLNGDSCAWQGIDSREIIFYNFEERAEIARRLGSGLNHSGALNIFNLVEKVLNMDTSFASPDATTSGGYSCAVGLLIGTSSGPVLIAGPIFRQSHGKSLKDLLPKDIPVNSSLDVTFVTHPAIATVPSILPRSQYSASTSRRDEATISYCHAVEYQSDSCDPTLQEVALQTTPSTSESDALPLGQNNDAFDYLFPVRSYELKQA
jgi:hypothetical protein